MLETDSHVVDPAAPLGELGALRCGKETLETMHDSRAFQVLRDKLLPFGWGNVTKLALASLLSILGARYAYGLEAWLGTRSSLLLVTGLPGVFYLVMAAARRPACSVLAFCTLAGSMSLKEPIFSGHLNRHIESKNRATVLSLISMVSGLYVALMGLLIGRIGDFSLTYAFVFIGVIVLAGTLLFRVR
jgi:hypothetical protein